MRTRHGLTLIATATACLTFRAPLHAQLALDIRPGTDGKIEINWNNVSAGSAYALEARPSLLSGSWKLAAPADQWPIADTHWSSDARGPMYFRGRAAQRGRILGSPMRLYTYSTTYINALIIAALGYPPPFTATYAVDFYRVTYETFDHRGLSAVASGALALPVGTSGVPLVSYQHGTIFKRGDAPSELPFPESPSLDQGLAIVMGTEGYAVALPDYLGLGTNSPPLHPYVHARSEAMACVDMLRASRTFISNNTTLNLNGKLFLIGYSQGGHATLALQKELEQNHADEFSITASAPMAGPHDMSGTMHARLLSDTPYSDPEYLAYLLFGYNGIYGFFDSASEILKSPYDTSLPPLMDGTHASTEVEAAMPAIAKQILKDEYLTAMENDTNHPFRMALRANDTYRWTPQSKTRLYHCAGDTVVPQANSLIAYSNFLARGAADVSFEDPSPASDHADGILPCFEAAKAWFDGL